jgi:hypothetical protein
MDSLAVEQKTSARRHGGASNDDSVNLGNMDSELRLRGQRQQIHYQVREQRPKSSLEEQFPVFSINGEFQFSARQMSSDILIKDYHFVDNGANYGKQNFTASDWLRLLFSLIIS